MPVIVAEYLGQRTDIDNPAILPYSGGIIPQCPFMNDPCSKIQQGYKPVCAVRDTNHTLWIVCRYRLCGTKKNIHLTGYQRDILTQIAKTIFNQNILNNQVLVRREVPLQVTGKSNYSADYVMMLEDPQQTITINGPRRVVLEMQGGGETANTGKITSHVSQWEQPLNITNRFLALPVSGSGLVVTNAWRRQQEQFLIKGNIVVQTGGGMVFCVGSLLYDYLEERLNFARFVNLRDYNWTLAIIRIEESQVTQISPGPIPLSIDSQHTLFTNYHNFVNSLTTQGNPSPGMFRGDFIDLAGNPITII